MTDNQNDQIEVDDLIEDIDDKLIIISMKIMMKIS